ncbi:unnamed protein product [Gemmata massiliana]|uniref:Uncharacterized protein n=1 Tax=Gemmata massiliana TaxID=1210884 RepID=A0A6P2DIB4_9BACT|nr:hypothetical protein [Gemmata massiliana]VTR99931.1 unnamed protein product [Gemmata massiliana]
MIAQWLAEPALEVWEAVEGNWPHRGLPYLEELTTGRVVLFAEGQAPYDDFGVCVLEVEPAEGEPFFARASETQPPEVE